jgi:hypothetical protein
MNYKTTLVVTALAVAALAALGSAFPMVGTAFASNGEEENGGDTNTVNSCSGEVDFADCRQQGFQVGRENEQNDFNFE